LILPAEFFAGTESGAKMESDAVIYFTVNDTTGIEGVDAEGEQTIYDLTGRKIETITKGGIYIINGKKVVVK
jgi:phage gp45-like